MTCVTYREVNHKLQLRAPHAVLIPEFADLTRAPIVTELIELDPDGWMRFRVLYGWDGPSGPTIRTKSSIRGSLYHDGAYELIRRGLLPLSMRDEADAVLRRVCLEDKMWPVRAWAWFKTVRIFAKPAATSQESPDETAGCGCLTSE